MATGTDTPKKKPFEERPKFLPNTERGRAIAAEYEDPPPFTLTPNTEAGRRSREERMVAQEMASAPTPTPTPTVSTAAPSSTPQAQLSEPPASLPGNPQPIAYGSGEPALASATPLPGTPPYVEPSQTPQPVLANPPAPVAQPIPFQGSGPEAILPTSVQTPTTAPVPRPATPTPTEPAPQGLVPGQNPAVVDAGIEDARISQGDGRTDIYRDPAGVERRGGTAGYQGSIFEGEAIEQARQQPGLEIPQESNVVRAVTDPSGRVVGYTRQWQTPEDAQNASRRANPNGIAPGPELSPIEQRDYDRAVAEAGAAFDARQAARGEQPSQQPRTELQEWQARYARQMGIKPSDDPRDPYKNSFGRGLQDREKAAQRADIDRTLAISDWNQGRNPSLNAISDAEVALAPGGFSSVGVNPELRRERVERGMGAELPGFLPMDMRDRIEARKEAFGPRLESREREQAELEGLSSSDAFESAFGPMNDRQDRRLSTRQLQEAIELARRLSAQT